jgi:hypothetical protein
MLSAASSGTRQLAEQAELSWIVTVRADGRPHLTPLVAVWSGDWDAKGSFGQTRHAFA